MADFFSTLPREIVGEIRRWLNTADRVRLQRVSRHMHASAPGPLLSDTWRIILTTCGSTRVRDVLLDARLDQRVPPSAYLLGTCYVWFQWFQLPATEMHEGYKVRGACATELYLIDTGRFPPTSLYPPFHACRWEAAIAEPPYVHGMLVRKPSSMMVVAPGNTFEQLRGSDSIGTVRPGYVPFLGRLDLLQENDWVFRERFHAKMKEGFRFPHQVKRPDTY